MTITDRETPDTVTPTIEDLVLGWCDSMEQRIADVREAVAGVEAHAATVADLVGPPTSVDLRDPLAPFKMADGTVCYLSIPVGGLRAGDGLQCVECHMPALIHVVFTATPDQKVGNGVYAGDSYCSLACLAKGALRIPLPEHEDEDDT